MTRIKTRSELNHLAQSLGQRDSQIANALTKTGPLPFRNRPATFASLLHAIVSQQVSVVSAQAMWKRIEAQVRPLSPQQFLDLDENIVEQLGLSGAKKTYCRALSEALVMGSLNLSRLSNLTDQDALEVLQQVKGIGRWTAEIFLLFSLGRADIWPAGDVALRTAAQALLALPERPDVEEMDVLGEKWRPLRGVAAQVLWAFYRVEKGLVQG